MSDSEPHVRLFDTTFAEESGAPRSTCEVVRPERVGFGAMRLVLGKHGGRRALRTRPERLGYSVCGQRLEDTLEMVERVAEQKKEIDDDDLRPVLDGHSSLHWST